MAKMLRVNMTDRTATYEDVPDKYKFLGGRGLTSTIVVLQKNWFLSPRAAGL
jgi:aldehyde:ferredoxin oxidoreductase